MNQQSAADSSRSILQLLMDTWACQALLLSCADAIAVLYNRFLSLAKVTCSRLLAGLQLATGAGWRWL